MDNIIPKDDAIIELAEIQSERRRNWRTVDKQKVKFLSTGDQARFDRVAAIAKVLEAMSPREWHSLLKRYSEMKAQESAQKPLFKM